MPTTDGYATKVGSSHVHDTSDLKKLLQEATAKIPSAARYNHNDLINKAISIKHQMSYNEPIEGQAKGMINELCRRLGSIVVKIKYNDELGWYTQSLYGHNVKMTRFQVILWRLFSIPPKGTVLDV